MPFVTLIPENFSSYRSAGAHAQRDNRHRESFRGVLIVMTVFMKDGKAVSLAGPMHDDVPVTAAATRGGAASGGFGEGCQDMIAWCAGISAYAAQQQSGGANPFARRDFSGGASGSVVVPSQGSLLWARCRMRVDHKAQQRQT